MNRKRCPADEFDTAKEVLDETKAKHTVLRRRILAAVKNLLQEHTLLPVSFKFQNTNLVGMLKGELRAEIEGINTIEKGKGTIGSKSNRSGGSSRSSKSPSPRSH